MIQAIEQYCEAAKCSQQIGVAKWTASTNFFEDGSSESLSKEFADTRSNRAVEYLLKCVHEEADKVKIEYSNQPHGGHNDEVYAYIFVGKKEHQRRCLHSRLLVDAL